MYQLSILLYEQQGRVPGHYIVVLVIRKKQTAWAVTVCTDYHMWSETEVCKVCTAEIWGLSKPSKQQDHH